MSQQPSSNAKQPNANDGADEGWHDQHHKSPQLLTVKNDCQSPQCKGSPGTKDADSANHDG
jgi:hypothetical protein